MTGGDVPLLERSASLFQIPRFDAPQDLGLLGHFSSSAHPRMSNLLLLRSRSAITVLPRTFHSTALEAVYDIMSIAKQRAHERLKRGDSRSSKRSDASRE